MEKTELIQKAKLAERYDDMATCMKTVTEQGAELTWSGAAGPPGGSSLASSRRPTPPTRSCS
uniref:14-3-3 domain-containing protein n=1 Tax=Nomascus leucogenys TaxID=61853 RepID=A0A2I3FUP3_NOMLE